MTIKKITLGALLLFIVGFTVGCIKDDRLNCPASERNAFLFNISLEEQKVMRASEPGQDLFNENKVEKLWLFAYKAGEENKFIAAPCEAVSGALYKVPLTAEQEQQLLGGVSLEFILVANKDFSTVPATKTALKSEIIENSELNSATPLSFVMLGMTTKTVNSADATTKNLGAIDLKRTLSKIRINTPSLTVDGYQIVGDAKAQLHNFRKKGYLGKEEALGSLESMSNYASLNQVMGSQKNTHFYSFWSTWNDLTEAPFIKLAVDIQKNGGSEPVKTHYYKIPIKASDSKLKYNTLYDINVVLETLGGDDENPIPVDVNQVSIKEWGAFEDMNSEVASAKYLFLEEHDVVMNLITDYTVSYKTSSKISSVSIVKCYYRYVNNNGVIVEEPIAPGTEFYPNIISHTGGKIKFSSKIPANNQPKYFIIEAKNKENIVDRLTAVQYPNQYIVFTMGTASSWRPDGTLAGGHLNNKAMYHIVTLLPKPTDTRILGFPKRVKAKFYKDSETVGMTEEITSDTEETKNMVSPSFELASQLGATVPMSLIEYLSFSDKLRYYSTLEAIRQSYAIHVCASYTETRVVNDITVKLEDWRLPTEAEILLIEELQTTPSGAVKKIMTGRYYWSSSGAVEIPSATTGGSSTNRAHTRCVRDVKDF